MRRRLDIFIHQPVNNARASHRVRDVSKERQLVLRLRKELAAIDDTKPGALAKYEAKLKELEAAEKAAANVKDVTGLHHPETGGVRTPIADTVRRILDGKVFGK